jgi:ubiquinone/menaquinone biosynthesis C-methylase UbiE
MHRAAQNSTRPESAGLVIHGAGRYDLLVWLFTLGGERKMRERILDLAQLQRGEHVLDIGCGTGTLAILAKRRVGEAGRVHGVDAAPEMIERARTKATRAGAELTLAAGIVQSLPLPDQAVDVALSTLMLHHLPRKARPEIVREIKRVLKPGGRFLAVDFVKPAGGRKSFMDRFHRHGFVRLDDVIEELKTAGFTVVRSGPVGEKDLHFVLAANGPARAGASVVTTRQAEDNLVADAPPAYRHGGGLLLAVLAMAAVLALIALHAGTASFLGLVSFDLRSNPFGYAAVAALALLIVVKLGILGLAHGFAAKLVGRWVGAREERSSED